MLFYTDGQAYVFLAMLVCGALVGAWYDVLRRVRRLTMAGGVLTALLDVLFAVIQAVARLRHPRGTQQPDGVVVVQRANADTGQLAHFLHGLHARILPSRRRKDKAFRSVRVNRNFKT